MELACNGSFIRTCVPLGLQPTLPDLYRSENWICVRFYYYRATMKNGGIEISKPIYEVVYSTSGVPVFFAQLTDTIGGYASANEMLEAPYAERQEKYIAELDCMLAHLEKTNNAVSDEQIQALHALWLDAQPEPLRPALEGRFIPPYPEK